MAHELDGRKYEQASAHQREWGTTLIAELGLRGTERVLDLGCGDGTLTARLADLLPQGQVVGIDISRGMIEAAQPKAKGNLRFILMNINDLRPQVGLTLLSSAAIPATTSGSHRLSEIYYSTYTLENNYAHERDGKTGYRFIAR